MRSWQTTWRLRVASSRWKTSGHTPSRSDTYVNPTISATRRTNTPHQQGLRPEPAAAAPALSSSPVLAPAQVGPVAGCPTLGTYRGAAAEKNERRGLFASLFHLYFPSLSWQIVGFHLLIHLRTRKRNACCVFLLLQASRLLAARPAPLAV